MQYHMDIIQTRCVGVVVTAEDYDEAKAKVLKMYEDGEFDMGQNGTGEVEFDIYDEEEE